MKRKGPLNRALFIWRTKMGKLKPTSTPSLQVLEDFLDFGTFTVPCTTMTNEEAKMAYVKQEISTERDDALEYIRDRVRCIYHDKYREIEKHFSDPEPKSFKEAQEWLKEGNFHVAKPSWMGDIDDEDECYANFFHWGKTPIDQKKRKEAIAALEKAKTTIKDICSIVTDEQARLKALQDFESQTFH